MSNIREKIGDINVPEIGDLSKTVKNAKAVIKQVQVNTINVRVMPKNSPFFVTTVGILHHYGDVTLGTVSIPSKMGFIVTDQSIIYDKDTKEEWIDIRQDHAVALSVPNYLNEFIQRAFEEFPDVEEWYIPCTINQVPVKGIILNHAQEQPKISVEGVPRSMVDWLDSIPMNVAITTRFLYDFTDQNIIQSMLPAEGSNGNVVTGLLGFLIGSVVTMIFMIFIM